MGSEDIFYFCFESINNQNRLTLTCHGCSHNGEMTWKLVGEFRLPLHGFGIKESSVNCGMEESMHIQKRRLRGKGSGNALPATE